MASRKAHQSRNRAVSPIEHDHAIHVARNGVNSARPMPDQPSRQAKADRCSVTALTIPLTTGDLPETGACEHCGQPVDRVYLTFEQPYVAQGRCMVARCERVPGYRCESCDDEFLYVPASIQVLEAALAVIKQAGDFQTATLVAASLVAGKQVDGDLKHAS